MGQYVLMIKKKGPGPGLLRGILEIWLNGVRDHLEKTQKHFGQVIQTLLETPLNQVSFKWARYTLHVPFGGLISNHLVSMIITLLRYF